jgi:hypothetical protein
LIIAILTSFCHRTGEGDDRVSSSVGDPGEPATSLGGVAVVARARRGTDAGPGKRAHLRK